MNDSLVITWPYIYDIYLTSIDHNTCFLLEELKQV